jgi:hypothetical protein
MRTTFENLRMNTPRTHVRSSRGDFDSNVTRKVGESVSTRNQLVTIFPEYIT